MNISGITNSSSATWRSTSKSTVSYDPLITEKSPEPDKSKAEENQDDIIASCAGNRNLLDFMDQEQLDDLRSRYDVTSIDLFQLKELGKELLEYGVITEEEYKDLGMVKYASPSFIHEGYKDYRSLLSSREDMEKISVATGGDMLDYLLSNIRFYNIQLSILQDDNVKTIDGSIQDRISNFSAILNQSIETSKVFIDIFSQLQ